MARTEWVICQERRLAEYTAVLNRPALNIKGGETVQCYSLGLFQATDEDGPNPYFIIELPNGQVTYAGPDQIRFIKEVD